MRLRTTAPPSAFLMLKPKRLCGSWFARKKTVKWELERRFPVRYTASNSPRRTNRAARGNSRRPGLLGREAMASLLAACRKHPAATFGLHAHAKTVRLGAPAFARLICSLRQSNPPLSYPAPCYLLCVTCRADPVFRAPLSAQADSLRQAAPAAVFESVSVVDPCVHGQESGGVAYRAGKSDTPLNCVHAVPTHKQATALSPKSS
jgi:hypothetical protein